MKTKRFLPLLFGLLALSSPCFAQSSKVAIVDTVAFGDPEKGITHLVRAATLVDREFEPRRAELRLMYSRLEQQRREFAFTGPIPTDPQPMTPERRRESKEKAEAMQRDFDEQLKEMERAYERRLREATASIHEDIRRSLKAFTETRGITILLNASNLSCLIGCNVETMADLNITEAFIAEYNRAHP